MTYNVFGGKLDLTPSVYISLLCAKTRSADLSD